MQEPFDVAIVGAGPAGIAAACVLADAGVKTVVLERGTYPGAKNMSGGVLYGHDLAQLIPDFPEKKCPLERNIVETRLWYLFRDGGYSVSYRDRIFGEERRYNAFTVGRATFDRWFAGQAQAKGALVVCSTVVTSLLRDTNNRVIGVSTDRPDGEIHCRVVLLADGINSPLAAAAGLRPEPQPHQVALAVKEVIELPQEVISDRFTVSQADGVAIEIVGEITQGMDGIAIIYTNRNSLSVAIGANLADFAARKIKPYDLLESFKSHPLVAPLLRGGKPREYLAHWLPEGGFDAIPQLCGDGYLIAGDSAMLFNPLHREGSNLAMTSGRLAAEAMIEALRKNDTTRSGLLGYVSRMQDSYVMKDMRKYRRFNEFRFNHHELFTSLPQLAGGAAREMLTVNGIPKRQKQEMIWQTIRRTIPLRRLVRIMWNGWRSIR